MKMQGERLIGARRLRVWAALNDPDVLKKSITGCESITKHSPTELEARVVAKIGPVKAGFSGNVTLSNLKPPESYTISGQGKGGAAGFAKGGANVKLTEQGASTLLTYDVDAQVGGRLAQIGSRLVDSTARKMADDFFANFAKVVESDTPIAGEKAEAAPVAKKAAPKTAAPPAKKAAAKKAAAEPAPAPTKKAAAKTAAPVAAKAAPAKKAAAKASPAKTTAAKAAPAKAAPAKAAAKASAKPAKAAAASTAAATSRRTRSAAQAEAEARTARLAAASSMPSATATPVAPAPPVQTSPAPVARPEPVRQPEPTVVRTEPANVSEPASSGNMLVWVIVALAVVLLLWWFLHR